MAVGFLILVVLVILLIVAVCTHYYVRRRKAVKGAQNRDPSYEDINHVTWQNSLEDIGTRVKVEPNPSYNSLKQRAQANEPVYAEIEDPIKIKLDNAYEPHSLCSCNGQTAVSENSASPKDSPVLLVNQDDRNLITSG